MIRKKPICLIILDGWGISENKKGNAIDRADTPNMDRYFNIYPNTRLDPAGKAVGLPEGQMGNSEVGHLNIGAGRIVYQDFNIISQAIKDGSFYDNEVLKDAVKNTLENNSSLHLTGLVSDGGVHSHYEHLIALVDLAGRENVKNIFIHAFLDGRDVPPRSAIPFLSNLENYLKNIGYGEIASVSGRYYGMDRDNRWDRIKKSYDVMVHRTGEKYSTAVELVENSYRNDISDEFVIPAGIALKDEKMGKINNGDSIIFFNFRPDRARQITKPFIFKQFDSFDRGNNPPKTYFTCMTEYDKKFNAPIAFKSDDIKSTLGEVISNNKLRQLRIAETEKYAHVTFFFNGGIEEPFKGEDRILIPSPNIATYDLKPEMSAIEVTGSLIAEIKKKIYDFIVINYANPDMVGHTGNIDAAVKAVETVDSCLGKVVDALNEIGGLAIITSDHGNAEEMIYVADETVMTAHSIFHVPFIICDRSIKIEEENKVYKLSDIAPTVLKLMGVKKPEKMTGKIIFMQASKNLGN